MRNLGDIQPGQTLGRYEFLVPIAQGGMAAVWAARLKGTRGFSKTVAVKTMLPNVSDDVQFERMFLDEAQIAARIVHPNVTQILDLGEQDNVLYLVMEWVDGEALSSIRRAAAKKNGIPRPIAVKMVMDACAGLHAAHELRDEAGQPVGLVHRDISPQNVLVTYQGVVKLVDFGVAKAAGRTTEDTNAGQVKGKPPYMSPEQALGDAIDRRTDVFALGIILYQLTTGKHPFRGETDMVTLQNIVSDRPVVQPRAHDPEFPKALEAVVMKALARAPGMRFQTAAEFETALERVFPPRIGRVKTEDVGEFVSGLLGQRGQERREALREAIRLADARAFGDEAGPAGVLRPLVEIGSTAFGRSQDDSMTGLAPPPIASAAGTLTGVDTPSVGGSDDEPTFDRFRASLPSYGEHPSSPPTPFSAWSPTPEARRSSNLGLILALGGVAVAGVVIVGAVAATTLWPRDSAESAAEPLASASGETAAPGEASGKVDVSGELRVEPTVPAEPVIELSDLEPSGTKQADAAAPRTPGIAAPSKVAPSKTPAEAEPVKKAPARPGGFVPPPVTDPGF